MKATGDGSLLMLLVASLAAVVAATGIILLISQATGEARDHRARYYGLPELREADEILDDAERRLNKFERTHQ